MIAQRCRWLRGLLPVCAWLMFPQFVVGGIASPHPIIVAQPDGTKIALYLRGDERFNWQEDLNGYTVLQRPDRVFVYATEPAEVAPAALRETDLVVGKVDPATQLKKRILPPRAEILKRRTNMFVAVAAAEPSKRVAPRGSVKNVVILMRFSNHQSRTVPTPQQVDRIFNAQGGDPLLAPSGSVRDFYRENSYGQMDLLSSVFVWVTLPKSEQYYADGTSGGGAKMHEAIRDALKLADAQINFKDFDQDQDGWVDAIAFLHSGYAAEWGGNDVDGTPYKSRIWSHRWAIPTWTSAEGVKVSPYHISPALWGTSGSAPGRIGVICHETGHFFGLPDLYDDAGGEGLGSWCLMANSWGFDQTQYYPPHMSAWCKAQLNWLAPSEINAGGNYQLASLAQTGQAYKITAGFPAGEYLLVENRQPAGFDRGIPAGAGGRGGLVVYHVDESKADNTDEGYPGQTGWPQNNNHYQIAVLQADGKYDLEKGMNRGDGDDPYRNGHKVTLSPTTVPDSNGYQGGQVTVLTHVIDQVSASGSSMSFQYSSGGSSAPTEAEWTFMVFMNGDNNLEPFALADFAEMAAVGSSDKVNIVVQFDRTPGHSSAQGDWKQTLRFLVRKNMLPTPANAVEDLGEVNMGDGAALAEFVQWAQTKYPAKRYLLSIWDHGQGWRVPSALSLPAIIGEDGNERRDAQIQFRSSLPVPSPSERNGQVWSRAIEPNMVTDGAVRYVSSDDTSGDHLFNREIQDILLTSLEEKLDVIGFDACLMAMLETGYALREVAEVMVASQELEPGDGWNYTTLMQGLVNTPTMDAEALGKLMVTTYATEYSSADPTTTLSAVRLSKMTGLASRVTLLSDSMRIRLSTEGARIRAARDACSVYAPGYGLHGIDLDRFCAEIATRSTNSTIRTRANSVRTQLKSAVIANYAGSDRQGSYGSTGLAIYFPVTKTQFDYDPDYEGYLESNLNWPVQFVQQHRWDNFLHAYFPLNP